jgi:hypothetical protein
MTGGAALAAGGEGARAGSGGKTGRAAVRSPRGEGREEGRAGPREEVGQGRKSPCGREGEGKDVGLGCLLLLFSLFFFFPTLN